VIIPEALLLVPGTLCDEQLFEPMMASLPATASVATLAGHDRVETAAAEIIGRAPARFVAVGFSLGGFVVLEMLRRCPERIGGVILLSGNAHPDVPSNAPLRRSEVGCAARVGMRPFIDENWRKYVGREALRDGGIRDRLGAMAETIGHDDHARQAEMNIHRPDFRDQVKSPGVPLLVVAGSDDAVCPRERYVDAACGGRLELVAGAGHFAPLEAPGQVATMVCEWIATEIPR